MPSYATAYNTREQPTVRVHKPPLLRYVEECPAIVVSDADEKYCLVGYGEVSISEYYDLVETGEDKQKLRVPRLRHLRPRARYQTTKDVSDPFEPEHFRKTIKSTSADPPDSPEIDFRAFFENLLKNPPPRRRQRTLILSTSAASEAIDARPRSG